MKEIPLITRGKVALVDDEDYETLMQWKWYWSGGYAVTWDGRKMHRMIMKPSPDYEVDHRNGNRLDNRRGNLRLASDAEQARNRKKYANKSSSFKGVSWETRDKRWRAYIKIGGKMNYLGHYEFESDAATAYDEAAIRHFGEFARLNFGQVPR